MRKLLPLVAGVGLAFSVLSANAIVILVDDFNVPDFGGGGAASSASAIDNTANAVSVLVDSRSLSNPNLAATRSFSVDCTSIGDPGTDCVTGSVGGVTGRLRVSAGNSNNGTGTVVWTLPSFTLPPPASLFFDVVFSAQGVPIAPNTVTFNFDGVGTNDFTLTNNTALINVSNTGLGFALTNTQAGFLAGGGTLSMVLTGNAGWNLTLDQFSINVPEPTSIALVGLALVGLGVASSRRKAG